MLNPFKKKEQNYQLDEMTLPSMSSSNPNSNNSNTNFSSDSNSMNMSSDNFGGNFNSNGFPDSGNNPMGQQPSLPEMNSSAFPASTDFQDNAQLANDQPFNQQQFPSQDSFSGYQTNDLGQQDSSSFSPQTPTSFDTAMSSTNSMNMPSSSNNQDNSLSNLQLETLDKKLTLLDSRMSVMEDKINKIFEMLSLEVSEDTRMKVHLNIDKSRFRR